MVPGLGFPVASVTELLAEHPGTGWGWQVWIRPRTRQSPHRFPPDVGVRQAIAGLPSRRIIGGNMNCRKYASCAAPGKDVRTGQRPG